MQNQIFHSKFHTKCIQFIEKVLNKRVMTPYDIVLEKKGFNLSLIISTKRECRKEN